MNKELPMSEEPIDSPTANETNESTLSPKDWAEQRLHAINEVVRFIGGDGADIDKVLPRPMTNPSEARQDDSEPAWTEEQVAMARTVAHSLGYGAEKDVPSGLGGVRIIEGGLAWKIAAELWAAEAEEFNVLVFAGSANRPLKEEEKIFIEDHLSMKTSDLETEYDFVVALAQNRAHLGTPQEETLAIGYGVSEGNPTVHEGTGQVSRLGNDGHAEIITLRVDREDYEEEGQPKYRHQPSSEVLMRLMSDMLSLQGDQETPVTLVTSNAYASRVTDAVRAGLKSGRHFGVTMYGRSTLATVKAEEMKPDTPLNQLPGELRVMHDKLSALLAELEETQA